MCCGKEEKMKYFKRGILVCAFLVQLCYVAWTCYLMYLGNMFGVEVCMADVMVITSSSLYMGIFIAPCTIFLTYRVTEDYNHLNYIARHKSRSSVFLKSCLQSLICGTVFTMYHICSVCFWSAILKLDDYNWKNMDSYYFFSSHRLAEAGFREFFVKYSYTLLVALWIVSIGAMVCKWILNGMVAFLFFISLGVLDFCLRNVKFLSNILVNYWNVDSNMKSNVILGGILLVLLTAAGVVLAKRKEYYSDFGG